MMRRAMKRREYVDMGMDMDMVQDVGLDMDITF